MKLRRLIVLAGLLFACWFATRSTATEPTHPPMRPLPVTSSRPLAQGPARFVSSTGDDQAEGSQDKPWRTINFALRQVSAGDTLYIRGGIYYERLVVPHSGEAGKPITLRSFPGEMVVIDGGLKEFYAEPAEAWIPAPDGASGEFVSARQYPQFGERPVVAAFPPAGWEPFYGKEDERPVVLGRFADSMVPLHGYRTIADLRDDSMLWDVESKFDVDASVNCGPGLWFNRQTNRIHIRLAHSTLDGLGERAYRGETDPRKLPLCISGPYGTDVLRINGVQHVVFEDLVLRGASSSALVNLYGSDEIVFDGLTLYGGAPALLANATSNLKIVDCAFHGLAAPWSSRASMKYRGTPSYLLITLNNQPLNHDWEISRCEFTDDHDGLWLRYVKNLKFHHNFVDNFNDDGLEVGARTGDQELYIYQNLISRCQITFTLHEMHRDESPAEVDPESGVYISRNVIDLRGGNFKGPPKEPDAAGSYLRGALTLCGDHGGPTWPNYYFYHNTVLRFDPAWRGYYGFGMGGRGLRGTKRRVFNNVFVQLEGMPGFNVTDTDDVAIDGNLHWGLVEGPQFKRDSIENRRPKGVFYPKLFPADVVANPNLKQLKQDRTAAFDATLTENSPAIDAGVELPQTWFDPVREQDAGSPDLGAIPAKVSAWRVGVRGRLNVFGEEAALVKESSAK